MTETKERKIRTLTLCEHEAELLVSPNPPPWLLDPENLHDPEDVEMLLKHVATIGHLNSLLGEASLRNDTGPGYVGLMMDVGGDLDVIDLESDIAGQVVHALRTTIARLSAIKDRVDRAIAAGEFPRPDVRWLAVVRDEETVLTDFPNLALNDVADHGGRIEYEFADGRREACPTNLLEKLRG